MYGVHTVCTSMPVCMHILYTPYVIVRMQVRPYNTSACSAMNMLFVSFHPHGRRETLWLRKTNIWVFSSGLHKQNMMFYACVCFKFNTIQLWFLVLNNESLQKQWLSISKASPNSSKAAQTKRKKEMIQRAENGSAFRNEQERVWLRRKCTDGYRKERGTEIQREGGRQVNPACLAGALHAAFYSSLWMKSSQANVFVMWNKSNGWSSPSAVALFHQFLHPSIRFCDLIPTTDPPGLEAWAQARIALPGSTFPPSETLSGLCH